MREREVWLTFPAKIYLVMSLHAVQIGLLYWLKYCVYLVIFLSVVCSGLMATFNYALAICMFLYACVYTPHV